jgi:hypothetical protein
MVFENSVKESIWTKGRGNDLSGELHDLYSSSVIIRAIENAGELHMQERRLHTKILVRNSKDCKNFSMTKTCQTDISRKKKPMLQLRLRPPDQQ